MNQEPQNKKEYTMTILVSAFLLVTILFFITTVFFNPKQKMTYPRYIPENNRIGNDFHLDYLFGERYFVDHKSAYIGDDPENWYTQNAYPPLFTLFLYPLFRYDITYITGYYFVAAGILVSFVWMVWILPAAYHKKGIFQMPAIIGFVLVTGIVSYGMQFALERGQLDMICMAISLTAVVLFWSHPKLRWLSYVLFIIGFSFKIYPFIFLLCFVENWRDWKKNVIRLGGISLATFASLFVMGMDGFNGFLKALTYQTSSSAYPRDHGFNYGVDYLVEVLSLPLSTTGVIIVKLCLEMLGFAMLFIIFKSYLRSSEEGGIYPPLILGCTLAAMVLFPASKDYKLAIICGAFCMYVLYLQQKLPGLAKRQEREVYLFFGIISFCYCAVLYSEAYRPLEMKNSFPLLYVMFIFVTLIEVVIPSPSVKVRPEVLQDAAGTGREQTPNKYGEDLGKLDKTLDRNLKLPIIGKHFGNTADPAKADP